MIVEHRYDVVIVGAGAQACELPWSPGPASAPRS